MKTRLWLAELLRVTGMENLNQLGDLLDGVDIKKMLYRYANGANVVSGKMLAEVEARVRQSGSRHTGSESFFLIGPGSPTETVEFAPLWDALDGTMEDVWNVMLTYDPDLAVQKFLGVPFNLRCAFLVVQVFGTTEPPQYWKEEEISNRVAEAYARGELAVDTDLVTFAIAAWRMAHFIGQDQPMLDYILIGLLDKAIPELLDRRFTIEVDKGEHRHGITADVLDHLEALAGQHLKEAGIAVKDMDYAANMYPAVESHPVRGVQVKFEQPFDHNFQFERLKRHSVAEFFARKRMTQDPIVTEGAAQAVA
ncbi:hypothetical protein E2K99_02030 [Herbaspirillum huttiense]|uniref:hypothetical protein n=1 Tax=Herbaspirillum huttiense TaxID=863372 RepID=UPI00106655FB|nr:hypothetical protein [Herbaspirillum huttiense]QBP73862.1 hypothetical protein E2K99_02030 [Herbaspirillum huttiense]